MRACVCAGCPAASHGHCSSFEVTMMMHMLRWFEEYRLLCLTPCTTGSGAFVLMECSGMLQAQTLAPFCPIHYAGTLFRFPLRGPQAAAQSDIKPGVATSPTDVLSLLASFQAQLPQVCGHIWAVHAFMPAQLGYSEQAVVPCSTAWSSGRAVPSNAVACILSCSASMHLRWGVNRITAQELHQ